MICEREYAKHLRAAAERECAAMKRYDLGEEPAPAPATGRRRETSLHEQAKPLVLEGLNSTQISAVLGCPRGSAVRAMRRAKEELGLA